jgi:hypothetical protein
VDFGHADLWFVDLRRAGGRTWKANSKSMLGPAEASSEDSADARGATRSDYGACAERLCGSIDNKHQHVAPPGSIIRSAVASSVGETSLGAADRRLNRPPCPPGRSSPRPNTAE